MRTLLSSREMLTKRRDLRSLEARRERKSISSSTDEIRKDYLHYKRSPTGFVLIGQIEKTIFVFDHFGVVQIGFHFLHHQGLKDHPCLPRCRHSPSEEIYFIVDSFGVRSDRKSHVRRMTADCSRGVRRRVMTETGEDMRVGCRRIEHVRHILNRSPCLEEEDEEESLHT